MAAGDSILILMGDRSRPTTTSWATPTRLSGASSPGESVPRISFDDTTQQYVDFLAIMPKHYGGGGLDVKLYHGAEDVAPDVCQWEVAFRKVEADVDDLDTTAHTYSYQTVVATAPSAVDEIAIATISFTSGQVDSVAADDYVIVRVSRNPVPSSGTNCTGYGHIYGLHIIET